MFIASTPVQAQQTDTMTAVLDLFKNAGGFFTNSQFWSAAFVNLQRDATDQNSDCLTNFNAYMDVYNNVISQVSDSTQYYAGLTEKGKGQGSTVGYYVYMGQRYLEIGTQSVNVFGQCSLDYYLGSLGNSVDSLSGFCNLGVNFMWRLFSGADAQLFTDLSSAIIANDMTKAGTNFGKFVKIFLMAEIPSTTELQTYTQVDGIGL